MQQQIKMSEVEIFCQVDSVDTMRKIALLDKFTSANGETFAIYSIVCAYDDLKGTAQIFVECERLDVKDVIGETLLNMGSLYHEIELVTRPVSGEALRRVRERGERLDVMLFTNGMERRAGLSERERNKRMRTELLCLWQYHSVQRIMN